MEALELNEEQKIILQKFRSNVSDVLQQHDDRYLVKWLLARNFNLNNAEKMLRDHYKFRKEICLDKLVETKDVSEGILAFTRAFILGYTKADIPVILFHFGNCDAKGFSRSITAKNWSEYLATILERHILQMKERNAKIGKCIETSIFLCDFKNAPYWHFFDNEVVRLSIQGFQLFQDNYPEFLDTFYVINAPKIIFYALNIFKRILSDRTLAKVKMFGEDGWQEEIFSQMSKDIIPAYLGGTREEPEGDPQCHAILRWQPKVPKSMYLVNQTSMKIEDPGVSQKTLSPRSMFEVSKTITETPSVISWEFQTKGYDIKFGLFYTNESKMNGASPLEELIPCKAVECHKSIEKGEFVCENEGKYTLRFDNSHSWFTRKCLLYKIEIKLSSNDSPAEEQTP